MIVLLASLAGTACALASAHTLDIAGADVRIRDVATLECVRPEFRKPLGNLVVATLPTHANEVTLARGALATLIRRRAPLLAGIEVGTTDQPVTLRRPVAAGVQPDATSGCWVAARAIPEGLSITGEAIQAAPCADRSGVPRIRYDRAQGIARATSNIAGGDYLGRLDVPAERFADTGDELSLVAIVGPVRIERSVWAVQPGRGASVFVRGEDGEVFRAPVQHLNSSGGAQ